MLALVGGQPQASEATHAVTAQTIVNTFPADADTRVHEALPTMNFGARVVLRVDGAADPEIESYLRFTVSGLAGSVQRATLRLHAIDDTVDGPKVSGTSNGWSESAMTWNDRPAPTTAAVDDAGAIAVDSWLELDVTSLVSTSGTFSFVLAATHQNSVDFDSRESTSVSLRPELVVETLTSNAPVNTSPPTISGILQEGNTLTAGSGTWNGSEPMTFAFQWQRCDSSGANCADIADASAQSYPLTQGDVGTMLKVAVTATNVEGSATATSAPSGPVIGAGDVVIAAAGDIASCTSSADEATAQLLDSIAPTRVLTLGDHVYPNGTDAEFADCYQPTWGRHKATTQPAPGNHDYNTPGAAGYYNYFGAAAGDPAKGYYAFDLGAWHIYALNSNCADVPCGAGSAQEQWLRADLAAHPQSCLAAYMHHPRFSSGATHGSTPGVSALWSALYDHRVDLVLEGHDHVYERFTRLDPTGAIDLTRGIRSFVVGTGGAGLYSFGTPLTGSEARSATHGVLKLILRSAGYDWTFMPVAGSSYTDSGSDTCDGALSDPIPPSAPTNLVSTTAEAGNVGLGWGESNDAVGVVAYQVYRDTQLIGSTTTTSFTDTSAVGGSTYQYYVTARDAAGNNSGPSNTVTVTVNGANQPPAITSNNGGDTASVSAPENQIAVTDVDATDPDPDPLAYSISGGPDAARFAINGSSGVLTFVAAPNFEAPTDVGGNNVYDVTVSVSDSNGGSDSQSLAVAVQNVNEFPPEITSNDGGASAAVSAAENQTAVTDVNATDGDGTALTYSISGGVDSGDFAIDPGTGVLTFVVAPDFEDPADANTDNVYEVTVEASDGSLSDTQAIAVTVNDVAEGGNSPPAITSDDGGATASKSVAENQTAVTDVNATDPDVGDALTYSIMGGVDSAAFTIVPATGVLTFLNAPSFELPTDFDLNNVYEVVARVSDGNGGLDTQAIAVTVTNVNEFAPVITSDGGDSAAALSKPENQTAVTDVNATDDDLQTLMYSISGGADAARFAIVPASGVLSFLRAPDFEAPTDDGGNNTYDVVVQASDGTLTDTQAIAVTVTDVLEATSLLYFSLGTAQTLSGVPFTAQDIVAFDGANYSLLFDGSDVGLDSTNESIDAFAVHEDGRLLVSTTGSFTVTGGLSGKDEDVIALTPSSLGDTTAGSWAMYFDGSTVGLESSGEDVDAIEPLAGGRILVSTSGAVSVTGVTGDDEDVLEFTPGSPGTWAMYFDGSDVGLTTSSEDVDGVALDGLGNVYLSTTGNFGVSGLTGADEDVFVFTPSSLGDVTAGTYSPTLYFEGSAFGLAANDVLAIDLP